MNSTFVHCMILYVFLVVNDWSVLITSERVGVSTAADVASRKPALGC